MQKISKNAKTNFSCFVCNFWLNSSYLPETICSSNECRLNIKVINSWLLSHVFVTILVVSVSISWSINLQTWYIEYFKLNVGFTVITVCDALMVKYIRFNEWSNLLLTKVNFLTITFLRHLNLQLLSIEQEYKFSFIWFIIFLKDNIISPSKLSLASLYTLLIYKQIVGCCGYKFYCWWYWVGIKLFFLRKVSFSRYWTVLFI